MTRTAGGRHIGASLYYVAAIWSGKEPLRGAKGEYRGSQEERQLSEKSSVESLDFELIHYQKISIEAFSEINTGETC
jgi:hypothetical protein